MPEAPPSIQGRVTSVVIGAAVVALLAVVVTVLVLSPAPPQDRLQSLAERLRCPVCTSVSVAESPSDTAVAMKQAITDQIAAGRTDEQIVDYFRARYGEWAVIDPPASGRTLLLWVLPGVAALAGAAVLLARVHRRPARGDGPAELSDDERARVEAALARRRAVRAGDVDPDAGDEP